VTVVALGSPPPICTVPVAMPIDGEPKGRDHHRGGAAGDGDGKETAAAATGAPNPLAAAEDVTCPADRTRCLLVLNECDVVPRLLGSPMPVATAAMLASTCPTTGGQAVMRRNVELMETMQQYAHPGDTEAVILRDGDAKSVPSSERAAVLHLHESLSPRLLEDHSIERYIEGLEIAAALAEAFEGGDWDDVDEAV
jgi:hypothetical protein